MKKILILLLCLLLLTGCATEPTPATEATEPPTEPTEATAAPTEPESLYDSQSEIEAATGSAVKAYALNRTGMRAIRTMGSDLLLFGETCLLKVGGEPLHILAETALELPLFASDPAVQVSEKGVTYYDTIQTQLVYLDTSLREVSRLDLPETLICSPALSHDRKNLYYLTDSALRALDLESGIDRLLKEMSFHQQSITGLHCDDSIIECSVTDESGNRTTQFLRVTTGELVWETDGSITLHTEGDRYFTTRLDGTYLEKLTGADASEILSLHCPAPDTEVFAFPVLNRGGVVTITCGTDAQILDYYELASGTRPYSLTLPVHLCPRSILADPEENCIWFLLYSDQDDSYALCRWDYTTNPTQDDTVYLGTRRTAENPDTQGLEACATLAKEISEKHRVKILTWLDAADAAPLDYTLEPEYQVEAVMDALHRLDAALANYPKGFLREAASEMGDGVLRIGLVRGIYGNTNQNKLTSAGGIQYWDDDMNAYLQLRIGIDMEQNLYHELFHVIESRIFSNSKALDDWEKLNPEGFEYSYNYLEYDTRQQDIFIDGETLAFIDAYCTTFPKEDRARVMEYAMMSGNEACFQSPVLQAKLRAVCVGIREAYRLKKADTAFLWEQYLLEPLYTAKK